MAPATIIPRRLATALSTPDSGGRINRAAHGGQPPARSGESERRDVPQPDNGRAAGGPARNTQEPVAWAVMPANRDYCVTLSTRKGSAQKEAERKVKFGEYATMDDIVVVPLYRHPPCQDSSQKNLTLTAREREAVRFCVTASLPETEKLGGVAGELCRMRAATLRGLLDRLQ
jgi:hypothetical protein